MPVKLRLLGHAVGLLFVGCSLCPGGSGVPKEDRAWKRYTNAQAGYCVSYPRRWHRGDAFDGAGLYASVASKHSTLPVAALDVVAFSETDSTTVTKVGLTSDVEDHLDGMRRFARAKDTEVLEQRAFEVSGAMGMFVKARYLDPLERSGWVEELIFARHKGNLYRLELQTRERLLPRFEPVFTRFVQSLTFDCRRK